MILDIFEDIFSDAMTTGNILGELHSNMSTDDVSSVLEHTGIDPSSLTSDAFDSIKDGINELESDYGSHNAFGT